MDDVGDRGGWKSTCMVDERKPVSRPKHARERQEAEKSIVLSK